MIDFQTKFWTNEIEEREEMHLEIGKALDGSAGLPSVDKVCLCIG